MASDSSRLGYFSHAGAVMVTMPCRLGRNNGVGGVARRESRDRSVSTKRSYVAWGE